MRRADICAAPPYNRMYYAYRRLNEPHTYAKLPGGSKRRKVNFVQSQWFVAETQPRKERIAELNLRRQSFANLCPRFRSMRRHARRMESVLAPVFPGYVFVRFDPKRDPWRAINGTLGVKRLLTSDPYNPVPMPENVMEQILARCENGLMTRLVDDLSPGTNVRIIDGPLADAVAEVESLNAAGRVRVLLRILGLSTPVTIDQANLAPA